MQCLCDSQPEVMRSQDVDLQPAYCKNISTAGEFVLTTVPDQRNDSNHGVQPDKIKSMNDKLNSVS